jgi:hypothetical protein
MIRKVPGSSLEDCPSDTRDNASVMLDSVYTLIDSAMCVV